MQTNFREPTSADRSTEFRVMAIYVFAVVLCSGLIFLLAPVPGITVWVILVALATFLLVRWNARHSGYRCAHCGHEFQVSVLTEMISPHGPGGGGWKYLRCPRCDRKSRARVLVVVD